MRTNFITVFIFPLFQLITAQCNTTINFDTVAFGVTSVTYRSKYANQNCSWSIPQPIKSSNIVLVDILHLHLRPKEDKLVLPNGRPYNQSAPKCVILQSAAKICALTQSKRDCQTVYLHQNEWQDLNITLNVGAHDRRRSMVILYKYIDCDSGTDITRSSTEKNNCGTLNVLSIVMICVCASLVVLTITVISIIKFRSSTKKAPQVSNDLVLSSPYMLPNPSSVYEQCAPLDPTYAVAMPI